MSLPKGINKIIEEYCYYPRVFERELYKMTFAILEDTKLWRTYDKYFVGLENIRFCWYCFYQNINGGWIINVKRI